MLYSTWHGTVRCTPKLLQQNPLLEHWVWTPCPRRRHSVRPALLSDDQPLPPPQPPTPSPPLPSGKDLLVLSTVSYALMTAGGIWAGDATGKVHLADLVMGADWQLGPALLWTAAMLVYPYLGVQLADKVEGFREMRSLFQTAIIPSMEQLSPWGIGLLALGAGIGEETFFRGFLQTAAISSLAGLGGGGLGQPVATCLGVGAVSLLFGVLHAATPMYFYFATAAGALFGIEFLTAGLPAAALTHALYDFIAILYIVKEWGSSSTATRSGA